MYVRSADLTRIVDALLRRTDMVPEDAPPVPAPTTAADAVDALDEAGMTYGLVLSGAYFWGSPSLGSPRMVPVLDSLGVEIGDERERVRAENLYVAEEVARYADRLVGACSVNPLAEYALEELDLCAADPRIGAFKLHFANSAVDLGDEIQIARLRTLFEALARTDLAAIVQVRNRGQGYGAVDAGIFIRKVLAAAPGVPVQIDHMAGWGPYDEATDSAMQAFLDAFEDGTLDRDRFTFGVGLGVDDPAEMDGDTETARRAAERNARLAERMRQVGIDRVVFSTDWPSFPPVGDPRTRIARNRARLRNMLPLEPDELDRFFSNVGPVFRNLIDSHSTAPRASRE